MDFRLLNQLQLPLFKMQKKLVRLSGADIRYINKLRGKDEPVYEVVNGKKMYRPRLSDSEIRSLEFDRKQRMNEVADLLLQSPKFDDSKYDVVITVTHKKKRYSHSFISHK